MTTRALLDTVFEKYSIVVGSQTDATPPPKPSVPAMKPGQLSGPAAPLRQPVTPAPPTMPQPKPASLPPPPALPPSAPPSTPMTSVPAPSIVPAQPTTTVPTTESPNTPVMTPAPAQTVVTGGSAPKGNYIPPAPTPVQYEELTSHLSDSSVPVEQRQQFAQKFLQDRVNASPELMRGFRDIQAGNANTPEAQKYQAQLKAAQDEFVQQHVQQAVQNNPDATQNPQTFGQFASQAANDALQKFQSMPMPMQLMMGIGLPMGLIGAMSSLFGEGGMGMGLLGALGLGAAGVGAAAGGMLGQDAQNMVGDAAYNMGTFFGAMPEKADLAPLLADDPIAALTGGAGSGDLSREAVKQKVEAGRAQAAQLQKLMDAPLPPEVKMRLMQKLDPRIDSPEKAQKAFTNAGALLQSYNNPDSPFAKQLQQGEDYGNDNTWSGWWKERYVRNFGLPKTSSANMNIVSLIEKWAFNDMDAKELNDLKTQSSRGVSYRVEDATRLNNLQKRQQAEQPTSKATVMAACQKAARCWAGYEPVPGKKPYSNDSCRPVGSKKKKKDTKKK